MPKLMLAALAAAWIVLLPACAKKDTPPEPGVVAVVNGQKITEPQVQEYINQYQQGMQTFLKGRLPDEQTGDLRRQVIEHTVNFMVVAQEARKKNMTISEEEMDRYLGQMKKTPQFQEVLKLRNLDEAGLREKLREEMLVMKFMQSQVTSEPEITGDEVQAFYREHQAEFRQPGRVRARHILVKADSRASPDKADPARQKAADLLARIRAGEDFAVLAKQHSQDPGTASKGGDLGYFKKGDLLPEFDRVAFFLEKDQVSEPVRTPLGYHLIQVTERQNETVPPLDQVKTQVRQLLMMKKGNDLLETVVMDLRKKADITIYEKQPAP